MWWESGFQSLPDPMAYEVKWTSSGALAWGPNLLEEATEQWGAAENCSGIQGTSAQFALCGGKLSMG